MAPLAPEQLQPNGPPSCINIGSPAQLKGFFIWIDDAREQRGFAAATPVTQTEFAGPSNSNFGALTRLNDDTSTKLCAILSPGFAAKL